MDFILEEYNNSNTRGRTKHLQHYASVGRKTLSSPGTVMFVVLHEMMHVMSRSDWRRDVYDIGKTFEEGMADVVPQVILREMLETNGPIENGRIKITLENTQKPLEQTGYTFENGWLRSMLYVLQQQGKDYEGIKEFLLGHKGCFFEMVMGKDFMKKFELTPNGEPKKVGFSYRDFYDANAQHLSGIDQSSTYYDMNFILPAFVMQDRFGNQEGYGRHIVDVLQSKGTYKTKGFINNIFGRRKLYEVSYEEYEEFSQLYRQANLCDKKYIKEKMQYIQSKYSELDDKVISEHGLEIVGALAGLLQGCDEEFDVATERGLNKTLLKAIRSAKIQARDPEKIQDVSKLYEILHSIDRKVFGKESLEVIVEALDGFEVDLAEYAQHSETRSLGGKLIEIAQNEEIALGEVRDTGIEFDKDMTRSAQMKGHA